MPGLTVDTVVVPSSKLLGVAGGKHGDPVGTAVNRHRRYRDRRLCGELRLDMSDGGVAGDQPVAMPVGMGHDIDEVWIIEGGG